MKRAGQAVRWHDPLFDIYSSDLYYTQLQLVEVMKEIPGFLYFQRGKSYVARNALVQERRPQKSTGRQTDEHKEALEKLASIRHKLRILGLPKPDIDELMKLAEPTGIAKVYATKKGIVIEQNAFEGTFVNTGTRIFTVADPKYVWAKLDAYESDLPWIGKGQEVHFQSDAYPGETFIGKIVYIDPIFDAVKRTFKVGVLYADQERKLRPNMLVRAVAYSRLNQEGKVVKNPEKAGEPPLVIPASAPLITGKRAVVYVRLPEDPGAFEGREVTLGPRANDYYIVREGLQEGELVVVNGNFKIDSAAQILAKPSMMNPRNIALNKTEDNASPQ